ncbi:MAG: TIM barrel protein, partial [Oscillospiraceae bacterium]|nr:TIM barrel protein [Oscillospiraceae bacterium]
YLREKGLGAFEYQCGHGVRVSEAVAKSLGKRAEEADVKISLHAPYYISLASAEEEKRQNSVVYILQAARACRLMGGNRIVVHPGGAGKTSRKEAVSLALETLMAARKRLDEEKLEGIFICPETMGKINQLGDLEEVMTLCKTDERMIPCIDFGHMNARTGGRASGYEGFSEMLNTIHNSLGAERGSSFHVHFSKIEYTQAGGEKRHLTFADTEYGPDFAPLGLLFKERGLTPTVICESSGTQIEDAAAMKAMYEAAGL